MATTTTQTIDPAHILAQLAALGSDAIRQRMDVLDAELDGLRVLLRAALARERGQRPPLATPPKGQEVPRAS